MLGFTGFAMPTPPPVNSEHPSKHTSSRGTARIAAIVLHHTGGTDSLAYLVENAKGVSTHVLISKPGVIYRMVPDALAAHTVGFSNLGLYLKGTAKSPNVCTLNIELENLGDGKDPYPAAQLDACAWQIADWWRLYGDLPVLTHELIDTQGKNDPAGLDVLGVLRRALAWYDGVRPAVPYTADSPLIGPPHADARTVLDAILTRPHGYNPDMVGVIVGLYWSICEAVGLDPVLALAQLVHETGNLTSFWSQPPQHNPAGIGVNGRAQAERPPSASGWAYNTQRNMWEQGVSFPNWPAAVQAHVGRLVAYATNPDVRTDAQASLVKTALKWRKLAEGVQGAAPTLRGLGGRWAPSASYGERIAETANRLIGGG